MPNLEFDFDWKEDDIIECPELDATLAALSIRIKDSILTRVVDPDDGMRVRDWIHVPLYPLAEWLAVNWWLLLHEPEDRRTDPFFQQQHQLGPSRDGYYFPNLEAVSFDTRTRISWKAEPLEWSSLEFLEKTGAEWIDKDEFRRVCADFIDRVIRRLSSRGIEGTLLQEDWAAIQGADDGERKFCAAAAGLGWDPYALDDAQRASVLRLGETLRGAVFEEAIPILNPATLESDTAAIVRALAAGKSAALPLRRLASIRGAACREAAAEASERPWLIGYSLARAVRRQLGLDGAPLTSWPELSRALDEPRIARGAAARLRHGNGAMRLDGVVTADADGRPALALRPGRPAALRFRFCRALAELLPAPRADALLTGANSTRQQRGRAFAAEFLAPADALRARIRRNPPDEEEIDELAWDFGVSPQTIRHQVENHGIARIRYAAAAPPTWAKEFAA